MKRIAVAVSLAVVLSLVVVAMAVATPPDVVPNGAWVIPGQNISVERIYTNEELTQKLFDIAERSDRCTVELAGWSAGGGSGLTATDKSFPIWVVKFGEPDATKHEILVEANVHGNELAGNQAIVNMIQYLAMSNNKEVREVLDKDVIWFLPMFNPDGAMWPTQLGEDRAPRRQNWQPWDAAAFGLPSGTSCESGYSSGARGFDVNRDFWYDLDVVNTDGSLDLTWLVDPSLHFPRGADGTNQFGYFLTPEARTWAKLFKELTPEFLIALHHQGTNEAGDTGEMVQVALLGQAIGNWGAGDGNGNWIYPSEHVNNWENTGFTGNVLELGQKVVLNVYEKNGGKFPGVFARYASDATAHSPSCSQGCANVNGCGIMLNEVRNQGTQKAMGMQIKILENNMWETFKAFADDSIYGVEIGPENSYGIGANYEVIPVQQRVANPHQPK